ncbi:MAG: ABC transporter ATP-binding protein [Planctomycetes bacterium]|nr:ABC transporter ATP-binding protein [Planctomycetota bacterium]
MDSIIKARSLTKLYGVVIGVNDVTLDLPPGVRGLLGPNGAGKSTFLKLVTGQLNPTEGEVRVFGERPWNNADVFRRIGFCPEQDSFYAFLTGYEFVRTLARLSGYEPAEAKRRAERAMERVGATEYMHRKIATYSKGMRQRTKMAQALVHDPALLILDEPLSGTDPIGRRDLTELVRGLGREGKSILVSSHVLHEVQAVTEEFLLIYGGRVLASGNVREIRGLMNEVPHRITIRCSDRKDVAQRLMRDLPITGIEIDEAREAVSVLTRDPGAFYEGFRRLALEDGVRIMEMTTEDDTMDAVFRYLVARD